MSSQPFDRVHRLYQEGRTALKQGDSRHAIACLREAARLAPHFKTYELLGEALMTTGKYKDAVLYLAAAAGLGEKQFRARYLLANALRALGPDWSDQAIAKLDECLRLNPVYKSARSLRETLLKENPTVAARLKAEEEWDANKASR